MPYEYPPPSSQADYSMAGDPYYLAPARHQQQLPEVQEHTFQSTMSRNMNGVPTDQVGAMMDLGLPQYTPGAPIDILEDISIPQPWPLTPAGQYSSQAGFGSHLVGVPTPRSTPQTFRMEVVGPASQGLKWADINPYASLDPEPEAQNYLPGQSPVTPTCAVPFNFNMSPDPYQCEHSTPPSTSQQESQMELGWQTVGNQTRRGPTSPTSPLAVRSSQLDAMAHPTSNQPYQWSGTVPPNQAMESWNDQTYQPGQAHVNPNRLQAPARPSTRRSQRRTASATPSIVSSFSCHTCNKPLASKSDRDHHARCHGERRHACSICGKAFQFPKDLKRHMKTHSPGERHFFCTWPGCSYCEKGFQRKDHLDRHFTKKHSKCMPPTPSTTLT